MLNRLVLFALGSIALTAALAPGLHKADAPRPPGSITAEELLHSTEKAPQSVRSSDAMVLQRDQSGQFRLTATIDNEDVSFMVDTGADVVALTEATAERLRILPAENEFQPLMKTASGTGYGAPIVLDTVEIGGEKFQQVEAVVMKGLETDLMGQSVLRRMGGVELQGDSMVIRPS